ncbi:uncharacterized protein [Prorops nasuta]|uniref:uncharacterized protein isoform X1 n=1 Tax=Prorops nasuta TaxID=863751 RepID=UPI0034CED848
MFSRSKSSQDRYGFGKSRKKDGTGTKKEYINSWILLRQVKKDRHRRREDRGKRRFDDESGHSAGVMLSSDSPPPMTTSLAPVGFDMPDEARPGKITPTKPLGDSEVIEEAVPITKKKLPSPEPQPKVHRNGLDVDHDVSSTKKLHQDDEENDRCIVDCVYYVQRCCECTIV